MRLCILGVTGSIGQSTLDVVARNPHIKVDSLVAGKRWKILLQQIRTHKPRLVVLQDEQAAELLSAEIKKTGLPTQVKAGSNAALAAAASDMADTVVAAIVGAAGLEPTCSCTCG